MVDLNRLCGLATGIITELFRDLRNAHPSLEKELSRDLETAKNRLAAEGVSFLTKTMPKMAAAVLAATQTGHLCVPSHFRKRKGSALPRFLGGLLGLCFTDDGSLRPDACPLALQEVLQITEFAKKVSLPYTPLQEQKVIDAFLQTEVDLEALTIADDMVIKRARATITAVFKDFNPFEILPKHGPGSVASGEKFEEKWVFSKHYAQIHSCYPYYEYFVPCRRGFLEKGEVKAYKQRERLLSGCAKVHLVDKDSRGPRLISLEPLEYQYIQQGLGRAIMAHLERHPITRGRVNFTDQSINRHFAREGSKDQSIATLDMKEASDRVSIKLVASLFQDCPDLLKCLMATRTPRTELPDGTVVTMRKFAPMGSALCFPVESVVFFALCKAIIETNGGSSGLLRVYGDDLIIPCSVALPVMNRLPLYGLKVNTDKSFTYGNFRESCGMDAFCGVQVTPTRWRKPWPRSKHDGEFIAALVDFANRLYKSGYWSTCSFLERKLRRFLPSMPAVGLTNRAGVLGFTRVTAKASYLIGDYEQEERLRYNVELQRLEYRAPVLAPKLRKTRIKGWRRMHANLLEQFTLSYPVGRSACGIRHAWVSMLDLVDNTSVS